VEGHLRRYSGSRTSRLPLSDTCVLRPSLGLDGTTSSILPPAFVTLLFSLGVPLLLFVALSLFRSTIMGVLAMGFLLVSPAFLASTFLQYSDIPVGFFFLLSTVLLIYAETLNGLTNTNVQHRGLYALAGFSAGCAALTKNEGLLFLLVFVAAWFLQVLLRRKPRQEFRKGLVFLAAAGFLLVPLGFHKASAPTNELIGTQKHRKPFKDHPGVPARGHPSVLRGEHQRPEIAFPDGPRAHEPLASICGLLFLLLVGIDEKRLRKTSTSFVWSIAFFLWLGYYFIYLTTPSDLKWHLATSMERLQVQTFPLILLAIGLSLRRIEARTRKDTDAKEAP